MRRTGRHRPSGPPAGSPFRLGWGAAGKPKSSAAFAPRGAAARPRYRKRRSISIVSPGITGVSSSASTSMVPVPSCRMMVIEEVEARRV